ncbi:MAG: putative Ig domain-containing protein [Planctomycetaceae bacterium]
MEPTEFDFGNIPSSTVSERYRRKKGMPAWVWLVACGLLGGAGWYGYIHFTPPPTITLVIPPDQEVSEFDDFRFKVGIKLSKVSSAGLTYSLVDPPAGAKIDPKTGKISWTPSEEQGPAAYTLTIRAAVSGNDELYNEQSLQVKVLEVNLPPVLSAIDDRTVSDGSPVTFVVNAVDDDLPAQELEYRLEPGAAAGAKIDAELGRFEWPVADAEPGTYEFTVVVTEKQSQGQSDRKRFSITIPAPTGLVKLIADLREEGLDVKELSRDDYPPFSVSRQVLEVGSHQLSVFEYDTPEAAAADALQIAEDASTLFGKPRDWPTPPRFYRDDRLVVLYEGDDQELIASLSRRVGIPFAVGTTPEPMPAAPVELATPADVVQLTELYQQKKLFKLREYPALRKIFAARFEEKFADEIRRGFGADYETMTSWLNEHPDIKEEFYTALDPQFDDIPAALELFAQIYKSFPKQIEPYANLAIAVAVTWDGSRSSVYDYTHHQRRTHSVMPPDAAGALENFKYFVDAENFMQGRAQFVPWEFLVHVVNHKTPIPERLWSLDAYLPSRVMFGECYSDVPYDDEMLRTSSRICKLDGRPYTLPNIRTLGGVCAMQADFAARVGKSLGVPAEYVAGESASGDRHAWVMWVELKQVTQTSIGFTLESHGRYFGDKYYVGTLTDPHTGEGITDRQLELRLQTVGLNAPAKRHADRIMSAYEQIRDEAKLDLTGQLMFLSSVIELSPGNEAAWVMLSKLSRENPSMDKKNKKLMQTALVMLFETFANAPDFTWVVFDDMITFLDKGKERPQLLLQLVNMYEGAGRPDLACEARLKLTDYLVAEKRIGEAIEGLAFTIKKFPDEGRYVPRMLDRLEEVCEGIEGADGELLVFYQQFLPTVPKTRGDDPSKYCMEMYERGIARFQKAGQIQLAQSYANLLGQMRAGK